MQDLLTLARRGVSITEVVNLNDIIAEYMKTPEQQKLELAHPTIGFKTCLGDDLLNIMGSPVHLSKTLMNLVSNAAEAIPDEGTVVISTVNRYVDRPKMSYDDLSEGDFVILEVSDTGTGISPPDLDRIFEPFYTRKIMGRSGTGLGLAVVWGTVKDHRGFIDVQSSPEKGTVFRLYFPVARKESAKAVATLPLQNYSGNGQVILVVDDMVEQGENCLPDTRQARISTAQRIEWRVSFLRSDPSLMWNHLRLDTWGALGWMIFSLCYLVVLLLRWKSQKKKTDCWMKQFFCRVQSIIPG